MLYDYQHSQRPQKMKRLLQIFAAQVIALALLIGSAVLVTPVLNAAASVTQGNEQMAAAPEQHDAECEHASVLSPRRMLVF